MICALEWHQYSYNDVACHIPVACGQKRRRLIVGDGFHAEKGPNFVLAGRRAAEAQRIVADQQALIAQLKASKQATLDAERSLQLYVSSLKHLEDHKRKIKAEHEPKRETLVKRDRRRLTLSGKEEPLSDRADRWELNPRKMGLCRQLHIARPLCRSPEALGSFALTLQ